MSDEQRRDDKTMADTTMAGTTAKGSAPAMPATRDAVTDNFVTVEEVTIEPVVVDVLTIEPVPPAPVPAPIASTPVASARNPRRAERRNVRSASGGTGRALLYGFGGLAALAAAGAGYVLMRERSVEKPRHRVVESDGDYEVRDYPELVVAEVVTRGERGQALNQGFEKLAAYIFAEARPGEKVAMTAPVLSANADAARVAGGVGVAGGEVDGDGWVTRFVMPAHYTRDTLPEPQAGVRIATVPARRVAAIRFAGGNAEALLADKEAQLRHWVGAKKLAVTGGAERAFYNSPMIPPPLRRNEILLPLA